MSEFFTGRGAPARIEEEGNASKELTAKERAMVSRIVSKEDVPSVEEARVHPDGRIVDADALALKRLSERTNDYAKEVDHGDVVG